jgi:hypothetical protein
MGDIMSSSSATPDIGELSNILLDKWDHDKIGVVTRQFGGQILNFVRGTTDVGIHLIHPLAPHLSLDHHLLLIS